MQHGPTPTATEELNARAWVSTDAQTSWFWLSPVQKVDRHRRQALVAISISSSAMSGRVSHWPPSAWLGEVGQDLLQHSILVWQDLYCRHFVTSGFGRKSSQGGCHDAVWRKGWPDYPLQMTMDHPIWEIRGNSNVFWSLKSIFSWLNHRFCWLNRKVPMFRKSWWTRLEDCELFFGIVWWTMSTFHLAGFMSNYQRIPIIPWSNPYGVGEIRMAKNSSFFMVKRPG
jgi:hypothetical protein